MRRSVPLVALVAALACAPTAGRNDQLALGAPATKIEACVDNALEASALVDRNAQRRRWSPRREGSRLRGVRLMNPPGQRIQSVTFGVETSRGEPHQLFVEYFSTGPSGMQPAQDPRLTELEEQAVGEIGAQLLREVHTLCTPSGPGQPTCSMVSQGHVGRCTLAT
jgi:hypothetical protein